VQAQGFWRVQGGDFANPPPRSREYRPPPRQFADPDRAANAAREATGGRVLGVQGDGCSACKARTAMANPVIESASSNRTVEFAISITILVAATCGTNDPITIGRIDICVS